MFAPTDAAFAKLPAGTVDTLVKPENKAMLTGILTYHVVPGRITAADIAAKAKANGGTRYLHHGAGRAADVQEVDGRLGRSWTAKGDTGKITIPNVYQSNGVIHVIDTVMMP